MRATNTEGISGIIKVVEKLKSGESYRMPLVLLEDYSATDVEIVEDTGDYDISEVICKIRLGHPTNGSKRELIPFVAKQLAAWFNQPEFERILTEKMLEKLSEGYRND